MSTPARAMPRRPSAPSTAPSTATPAAPTPAASRPSPTRGWGACRRREADLREGDRAAARLLGEPQLPRRVPGAQGRYDEAERRFARRGAGSRQRARLANLGALLNPPGAARRGGRGPPRTRWRCARPTPPLEPRRRAVLPGTLRRGGTRLRASPRARRPRLPGLAQPRPVALLGARRAAARGRRPSPAAARRAQERRAVDPTDALLLADLADCQRIPRGAGASRTELRRALALAPADVEVAGDRRRSAGAPGRSGGGPRDAGSGAARRLSARARRARPGPRRLRADPRYGDVNASSGPSASPGRRRRQGMPDARVRQVFGSTGGLRLRRAARGDQPGRRAPGGGWSSSTADQHAASATVTRCTWCAVPRRAFLQLRPVHARRAGRRMSSTGRRYRSAPYSTARSSATTGLDPGGTPPGIIIDATAVAPWRHRRPVRLRRAQRGGLSEGFRRSRRPRRLARVMASSPNRFWTSSRTRSSGEGTLGSSNRASWGFAVAEVGRVDPEKPHLPAPVHLGEQLGGHAEERRCRSRWLPSACARGSWCGSPRPGT